VKEVGSNFFKNRRVLLTLVIADLMLAVKYVDVFVRVCFHVHGLCSGSYWCSKSKSGWKTFFYEYLWQNL